MESEVDLLARVMVAADVALPGIGHRVYQNAVRRYRVSLEVACRHMAHLVSGPRRKTTCSKQQKWKSSTCDVLVFCL